VSICTYCHGKSDGVTSNPLESIHSQAANTLHDGQIKTDLREDIDWY
jgi:hypothetical protein